ncbi:4-O-methyl-glucuronoyl methylesterase 1-like [Osmia bicornis bicornis]|uniref:4-O-methyl-glucuronoyl methylesterase 1-like n=1 Tax=Osmia bicornis bicornis TaxID=1437191 RepID=UPI001EAF47DB|nr:4-O-methyl-glucuronoyl methylesterase 1-like [Osmia bicornis bicornis]
MSIMKYLMFLIVGVTTATNTHNICNKTNCREFYKCVGGYGFLIDSPSNHGVQLVFNENVTICVWESVPCPGDSTVTPTTPTPTPTTPTTPTPTTPTTPTPTTPTTTKRPPWLPDCTIIGDRKVPHKDCHKFYYCTKGEPTEGQCPEDMYFNPIVAECDIGKC